MRDGRWSVSVAGAAVFMLTGASPVTLTLKPECVISAGMQSCPANRLRLVGRSGVL